MRYLKLNLLSQITDDLYKLSIFSNNWFVSNGFKVLNIPKHVICKDIRLCKLILKFDGKPVIFHMAPNTFYKFHIDETRRCAINLLISGTNSHCYYADLSEYEEIFENIEELNYEKNNYYLINTKLKHAVVNLNNDRYMLSIGFDNYDFDTIKDYYLNN